jgi:hypothetical protein
MLVTARQLGGRGAPNLVRCSRAAGFKSDCARTVHECLVLSLLGLAFERKQIPRFVVNAGS